MDYIVEIYFCGGIREVVKISESEMSLALKLYLRLSTVNHVVVRHK